MKLYWKIVLSIFVVSVGVWLAPTVASAATLRFNPSPVTIGKDQTGEVQIVASSDVPINSVEVEFTYPTNLV